MSITRATLSQATCGTLTFDRDYDDYSIKAHQQYKIHKADGYCYIRTTDTIRTDNNEIREDILPHINLTT